MELSVRRPFFFAKDFKSEKVASLAVHNAPTSCMRLCMSKTVCPLREEVENGVVEFKELQD